MVDIVDDMVLRGGRPNYVEMTEYIYESLHEESTRNEGGIAGLRQTQCG